MCIRDNNCFDHLRELTDAEEKFDLVVLDPPAFTKNKAALPAALRGYKEINLRGLKLVRPSGFLVTCSCSQHVLPEAFQTMVNEAARDAKKRIRLVEFRTQGKDHPILPQAVETKYLKLSLIHIYWRGGRFDRVLGGGHRRRAVDDAPVHHELYLRAQRRNAQSDVRLWPL